MRLCRIANRALMKKMMKRFCRPSARAVAFVSAASLAIACSGDGVINNGTGAQVGVAGSGTSSQTASTTRAGAGGPASAGAGGTASAGAGGTASTGTGGSGGGPAIDGEAPRGSNDGGAPVGWLFTKGNRIYVSDGTSTGKPWIGRG